MNDDDGAWFAPKRYGYGSGLPIAWQGWALLGGYLVLLLVLSASLDRYPGVGMALIVGATLAFIVIAARRTRGGWRWRWGD